MSSTAGSFASASSSVGGAVFVEVETVNEDDDDDDTSINSGASTDSSVSDVVDGGHHPHPPPKKHGQHLEQHQEEFEDEVVVVMANGNRNTVGRTPSSTSGFIPDPDEWLNVVNSAADTFMGASSGAGGGGGGGGAGGGDNMYDNNNNNNNGLLPHPDELKLETTTKNSTGRENFDEPDHATPFVKVADDDAGRASLPHPDDLLNSTNHQMFAVNSTSHGASLPHVDEVKTETRDNTKNNNVGNDGGGGVDHFDVFQMNTVGVDSLPSTKEEVVGGVGANHDFNVNSTDHASSLPHVDEIKADLRNNNTNTAGTTGGSDEPDQLDIFQMNTVGADSLPSNKEEIVGGVGANHGFNVNSTDHAASLPHVDEYKADAPGAIGGIGISGNDGDDDDIKLTATGSLFTPNTTAVDSLPQPGHDDEKTFQVNSTGHGASLPHAEEVKASGGNGGEKKNKNNKHNNNSKRNKTKKPRNNETNNTNSSSNIGKANGENDKDGLNLNLTILDYDSDKDPAEKKRPYGGNVDDSDNSDDEPDHDTPHAVQSRSGDHSSSLPHPEELQTDTNITKKGGGGGRSSSIAAATSKFFSSIVRVNSKDEDYKDEDGGGGRNNSRTIIAKEDDDEDLASSHVGDDDDDDPSSSANGESEMTSISATDKKRKKNKKSKKSKKDKRRKKKSSKRHIEDEDGEEDRFTDEPGALAAVAVTRRRNVDFTIDSDSDDEEENGGDLENAHSNSKALVRYDLSTSQSDGVFLKRARSSTDGSKPSLRSNSLVQSIRGISSRLGFESNHEPTHRMDDEEHVEFGLSLEDDEDDESFYLKNDTKRHYRTTMIMRHKKTCIIVGLIVLFLALLIPLAILSSEKRNEQLNTVDTSSVAAPPTSAPTTAAAPAAPSPAPTLPPVAENCEDRISLAPEMAGRDCYGPDEFINITFTQCYPSPDDWIGLFPSGAVYFGRLWREYYNWIWTCGAEACTEQQVTEDLPIRGKFSTPMLDPGDYQLFIVLDSGWPYLPLVSSEVIRVRTWCSIADDEPESLPSDGVRGRQLRGL